MLAAILGEVELLGGRIEVPSLTKPVAFVSQTPWLQNATIKDNILFGAPVDETRYQKVLKACALETDLAALPKGDQTYVGLRGVKLSGGQRARVSLGRALYSNADLLIMDDIFSALDSHVSKEIFKAMTGELGQGRTRILATHHVSLCLPQAKHIVYIKNNTMSYCQSTALVKASFDVVEPEKSIQQNTSADEKANTPAKDKPKAKPKANTTEPESELEFYKSYFGAAAGLKLAMIYTLGLLGKQVMGALITWILGRINSQRSTQQ